MCHDTLCRRAAQADGSLRGSVALQFPDLFARDTREQPLERSVVEAEDARRDGEMVQERQVTADDDGGLERNLLSARVGADTVTRR